MLSHFSCRIIKILLIVPPGWIDFSCELVQDERDNVKLISVNVKLISVIIKDACSIPVRFASVHRCSSGLSLRIVIVEHSNWDMGPSRNLHVEIADLHLGLCKRELEIKLLGMSALNDHHSQKQMDC